ncbi:hypothetical protein BFW38_06460 [Terasakiispira papahanaumokuakeensis]|uniref:Uncharacterized protein n=1 Tax=Terasakiispira papahanaumokuakeensis TaxID=197479 RepID=A0A1E2V8C2_9GAMM|nr:DUF1799 domain-containing protein [Terasakiispira papahanaumokuakeensis]ODC03237.1 hypothetical protein BFW38_06460 [Terasakiispira papahanaumokuakeensis]
MRGGPARWDDADLEGLVNAESAHKIRAARRQAPDVLWVLPECWEACALWRRVGHQLRYAPTGRVIGLDYTQLVAVTELQAIPEAQRAALFDQIQLIERGALAEINRK